MKNIWMLIVANIRKNKGQTISLFLFVLIAAMFLNMGLVIFIGITSFFDQRVEELHAEHFAEIYKDGVLIEDKMHYVKNYPGVTEIETQKIIGGLGNYMMNGTENMAYIYFARMNENQKMGVPSIVGESRPLTGDAIYIPYFMILNGNYKIGDSFPVNILGTEMKFTVAGGSEEIMFGAQLNTIHRFYVSDETFNVLQEEFSDGGNTLLSVQFENKGDAVFLGNNLKKEFSIEGLAFTFTIEAVKMTRTMIAVITTIIIVAFALILLIVSLIVIRFRITCSIEESMTNIGTLKAIGYKNKQIVLSIVGQFGITALIGGIFGIALSYAVMPFIIEVLRPTFALLWNLEFDILFALISLLIVLSAIIITTFISARKINKLHPLIALRGGITTHSFKKNTFPLDKSCGSLHFLIALKQLFQNKRQAVMISIIIAAVTMASVAGIAVNYTMNENTNNFARMLVGEMPDVLFTLKEGEDGEAFKERLLANIDVRKAFGYQLPINLLADEIGIMATVVEDSSLLEGKMVIDGRYPKHDNEIALGPAISKASGKKTGDTIIIKSGEIQKEYLVIGIIQFVNNNGFVALITGNGLSQIQPDFKFAGYSAYLNDGSNVSDFIESVKVAEGDIFGNVEDTNKYADSILGNMSEIFAVVAVGIVIITAIVVVMTLYMIIKTVIYRRKCELGIQKALGFTTLQLMNQIALNMIPVILFGVTVGAIAGYFGFNPILSALLSGAGVVKLDLPIPLNQTIMICLALVMLAYAVSMLIAWRIRKISAYVLISE